MNDSLLPLEESSFNFSTLSSYKSHLDLLLLALESLTDIKGDAIIKAAKSLNLDAEIVEELAAYNWHQQAKETEQLDLNKETIRCLIQALCLLVKQHQELLRRGVSLLEQGNQFSQGNQRMTLLGNYLERFQQRYHQYRKGKDINQEKLAPLACKLLIDLLFYSDDNGENRLWLTLNRRN